MRMSMKKAKDIVWSSQHDYLLDSKDTGYSNVQEGKTSYYHRIKTPRTEASIPFGKIGG